MGAGGVQLARVRDMLGLADRGRIFDLFEKLMGGATPEALDMLARLHRDGAEPAQVLTDLAEAVHITTRAKMLGAAAAGDGLTSDERARAAALGERLSVAILARAWQMLLKGLEEIAEAPNQSAAAEMVLIRLAYTADLPAPADIINALGGAPQRSPAKPAEKVERRPAVGSPVDALEAADDEEAPPEDDIGPGDGATGGTLPILRTFADVVALAGDRREAKLKVHLEEHVSLVRFDPAGSLELHLLPGAPKELGNELREKLNAWTGKRWMVALSKAPGAPPLGQVERERKAAEVRDIAKHPAVAAVLQQFPDAQITDVRPLPGTPADDTGTG
jgi:DNA polymerase-3 subunit gamma/tau